jgi:hypothetical protein
LRRLRLRYDQQVPEWEGGHQLGHIRRSARVDHYPKGWSKPQDEIIGWPIETLIRPGDLPAEATKRLVRHGADRRVALAEVLGCPPAIFVLHIARMGWYLLLAVMPDVPGVALSCCR